VLFFHHFINRHLPSHHRFLGIELSQLVLSEDEERLLVMLLHEKRLSTNDAGTTVLSTIIYMAKKKPFDLLLQLSFAPTV
jgi:hypothetical protein